MRKHFVLVASLASVLLFTGCDCNSNKCAAPVNDCNTCEAAPVVVAATASSGKVVYAAPETTAPNIVASGVHAVEGVVHNVGSAIGSALHIASATTADANIETITPEQYQALIAAGKVKDTAYRAPGSSSVAEVATESASEMATIPSRFQSASAPVQKPAAKEVGAAAGEEPLRDDELVTPAILNAAALREAGITTARISVTGAPSSDVPTIPAMDLPDGWNYIHEKDLGIAAQSIESPSVEQYFSDARSKRSGSADDI